MQLYSYLSIAWLSLAQFGIKRGSREIAGLALSAGKEIHLPASLRLTNEHVVSIISEKKCKITP